MGSKAALGALIVSLGLLGGCQGEAKERQSLIDAGIKSCVDGFQASGAAAGTGADTQRICSCAIGKMTEGKSLEEIRRVSRQETPTQADVQAFGTCAIEEIQRKVSNEAQPK